MNKIAFFISVALLVPLTAVAENFCLLVVQEGYSVRNPPRALREELKSIDLVYFSTNSPEECFVEAIDLAMDYETARPSDDFTYVVAWQYQVEGWGSFNDEFGRITNHTNASKYAIGKNYGIKYLRPMYQVRKKRRKFPRNRPDIPKNKRPYHREGPTSRPLQ